MSGAIEEIRPVLVAEDVELEAQALFDVIEGSCVRMDARLARRAIASLLRTSAVLADLVAG